MFINVLIYPAWVISSFYFCFFPLSCLLFFRFFFVTSLYTYILRLRLLCCSFITLRFVLSSSASVSGLFRLGSVYNMTTTWSLEGQFWRENQSVKSLPPPVQIDPLLCIPSVMLRQPASQANAQKNVTMLKESELEKDDMRKSEREAVDTAKKVRRSVSHDPVQRDTQQYYPLYCVQNKSFHRYLSEDNRAAFGRERVQGY